MMMTSLLPTRRLLILALVVAAVAASTARAAEPPAAFNVRSRSSDTIYLEGGRAEGLSVGVQLEVFRGNETIAEIEVIFVAEHSASCKVLMEQLPIEAGDQAVFPGGTAPPPPVTPAQPDPGFQAPTGPAAAYTAPRKRTRVSGSLTVDGESFTDDSGRGLDYDRLAARLNFRARDLGGRPYAVVVRARALRWDRERSLDALVPETESRNRLYEASFTYAPAMGRFNYAVGRLGTSPFVGIGYLDGALGQVRVGAGFDLGAFYGAKVDFDDFGFDSSGVKYGAYTRYRSQPTGRGLELYLAGVREEGEEAVSREYAALDIRYRGAGSWMFAQHTEIDFNRDWRAEVSPSGTQLSNLNLIASGRLSKAFRLIITYDRNQRYRTDETRFIPESLFDDRWRQGFRARLVYGRSGGIQIGVNAGLRDRQDGGDNAVSFGVNVYHPNVGIPGLLIGGNVNAFSNPMTDGIVATVRVAKNFRAGHEVSLLLGTLRQEYDGYGPSLQDQWARLGAWFELPARMFARAELEFNTGDDLEGTRVSIGLGYRF